MRAGGAAVKPDIKRAHVLLIAFPYRVEVPREKVTGSTFNAFGIDDKRIQSGTKRDTKIGLNSTVHDLSTQTKFFEAAGAVIFKHISGSTKHATGQTLHNFFNEGETNWGYKIVTYSGHGWSEEGKWGNWVTKNEKGDNEFISLKFVLALWGNSKAFHNGAKLCLVLDCCHSEGWVKRARELYGKAPWHKILGSVAIQASCLIREEAIGIPSVGGIFTWLWQQVEIRRLGDVKSYLENRCSGTKLDEKAKEAFIEMYPKPQARYAAIPYHRPLTRHAAAVLLHYGLTYKENGEDVNRNLHPTFFVPWQNVDTFEQPIWSGKYRLNLTFFSHCNKKLEPVLVKPPPQIDGKALSKDPEAEESIKDMNAQFCPIEQQAKVSPAARNNSPMITF